MREGLPCPSALARFWESLLQEVDGGDEIAVVDDHQQVDRIEVGFTAKATSQVGTLVDGRKGFAALRTDEADPSVSYFMRPAEKGENVRERDIVSHLVELVPSKEFGHGGPLFAPSASELGRHVIKESKAEEP